MKSSIRSQNTVPLMSRPIRKVHFPPSKRLFDGIIGRFNQQMAMEIHFRNITYHTWNTHDCNICLRCNCIVQYMLHGVRSIQYFNIFFKYKRCCLLNGLNEIRNCTTDTWWGDLFDLIIVGWLGWRKILHRQTLPMSYGGWDPKNACVGWGFAQGGLLFSIDLLWTLFYVEIIWVFSVKFFHFGSAVQRKLTFIQRFKTFDVYFMLLESEVKISVILTYILREGKVR